MCYVVLWNIWGRPMLEAERFDTKGDADVFARRSELHDDGFPHVVVELPRDLFSESEFQLEGNGDDHVPEGRRR